MNRRIVTMIAALTLALPGIAADKKMAAPATPGAEMMAKMMKMTTPGADHQLLSPLVGKWNATVRMWMAPGAKAEESKGTSETTWEYGGRFLKQVYKGDWNGQPFEGVGYTGFDIVRGEYEGIWIDSMSTGIMKSHGKLDPATKVFKFEGTMSCPMTGEKEMWVRSELKINSPDMNSYSTFSKGPDGKEMKNMEIVYTRIK